MLETIRQFAEEQLVAVDAADEGRIAHARYFASCESELLALWDGPRQREAYARFTVELPNLRNAFRYAADHDDLDSAAAIASFATFLGMWIEQYEPIAWAEEIVQRAEAVQHPRLAQLYTMAAQGFVGNSATRSFQYVEAGQIAIESGCFDPLLHEYEATISTAYLIAGEPERAITWCRRLIARGAGAHTVPRACLAIALSIAGAHDEARVTSEGLLADADATDNPGVQSFALLAYGWALGHDDPLAAYGVLRRGIAVAQGSGSRQYESSLAICLARLAVALGRPNEAFDYLTLAIRHYYDSGVFQLMPGPVGLVATQLMKLEHYEEAATLSGFSNILARNAFPEISTAVARLRDIFGDQAYEALAQTGASMSNAAITTYAFEQIDLARAELQ